jgi:cell division protein FtsW
LLAVALLLSVAVLIPGVGAEINGARRWLRVGVGPAALSFQPSELTKLALIVFLAFWLGRRGEQVRSFKSTFLPAVAIIGLAVGLVALEDFGTAAVIGLAAVAVLALAGVPLLYLLSLAPPALIGFYLLVVQVPTRWSRIVAFMDPWNEASRWTYQGRQALIAIGSGGLWGKGLGNGALKLGYLPEDSTDFIFAVLCEETGFVGAALLLGLIACLLALCWRAASRAPDRSGRILAAGLGLLIVLQALMHVAVNMGSAPPTGMSLPLVSAGGTALVLVAAAVGLIISVTAHSEPSAEIQG